MAGDCKDDLDLAARVVQGDAGAFDVFYARHADLVFAFIYHQLNGARPDAEEVWQDTFVAAIRALPSYHGESHLSSWLCSVARHKIADYWRRRNRRAHTVFLFPPAELAKLMDEGPLPDEVLNHCAARLRVIEVLGALPSDYGAALVARYSDGCSVEEVARRLGKSYKATESLLSRAREAFRAALSEQPEAEL